MLTMGNWQKWGDVIKFLALRCNNLMKDTCLNHRGKTLHVQDEFWASHLHLAYLRLWEEQTKNMLIVPTQEQTYIEKIMSETSRIQGHYMQSPRRNKLQSETLKIKRSQNTYKHFEKTQEGKITFQKLLWRQAEGDRRREIAKRI